MHRVVCCYPDVDGLVGVAAAHTRRRLLLTYPRERPWTRAGVRVINLFMRLSSSDFRAFVHPVARMTAAAREGRARARTPRVGAAWSGRTPSTSGYRASSRVRAPRRRSSRRRRSRSGSSYPSLPSGRTASRAGAPRPSPSRNRGRSRARAGRPDEVEPASESGERSVILRRRQGRHAPDGAVERDGVDRTRRSGGRQSARDVDRRAQRGDARIARAGRQPGDGRAAAPRGTVRGGSRLRTASRCSRRRGTRGRRSRRHRGRRAARRARVPRRPLRVRGSTRTTLGIDTLSPPPKR